jgi:peptidoglycan L-alanyl-D-glutamate endopeptidase CwlK
MMLTERDHKRLQGVRAELRDVAQLASARIPAEMPGVTFFITEGLRTEERQRELLIAGASRTMKSNHITGRAFDFALSVRGEVRWDWPLFKKAGQIIKACAEDIGVRIVWGGDWKTLTDGPHIELAKDFP